MLNYALQKTTKVSLKYKPFFKILLWVLFRDESAVWVFSFDIYSKFLTRKQRSSYKTDRTEIQAKLNILIG